MCYVVLKRFMRSYYTVYMINYFQEKTMALAGVREFIFIWELSSETLVNFFKAHYGRIIHMSSLTDGMFF